MPSDKTQVISELIAGSGEALARSVGGTMIDNGWIVRRVVISGEATVYSAPDTPIEDVEAFVARLISDGSLPTHVTIEAGDG